MRHPIARSLLIVSLLLVFPFFALTTVRAHGRLLQPPAATNGGPDDDYQFCFEGPCACGADFPGAGEIVATYIEGATITVAMRIPRM